MRRNLLIGKVNAQLRRDVGLRYVAGLVGYVMATLLAFIAPWLTVAVSAALALLIISPLVLTEVDHPAKACFGSQARDAPPHPRKWFRLLPDYL